MNSAEGSLPGPHRAPGRHRKEHLNFVRCIEDVGLGARSFGRKDRVDQAKDLLGVVGGSNNTEIRRREPIAQRLGFTGSPQNGIPLVAELANAGFGVGECLWRRKIRADVLPHRHVADSIPPVDESLLCQVIERLESGRHVG